jgi:hypothetical protein
LKFTDPRWHARSTRFLERARSEELFEFRDELFDFDRIDIRRGLEIASRQKRSKIGLGVAAGSGLLAVLFPAFFGTVDRFAVEALQQVPGLNGALKQIDPNNITLDDAELLIEMMREKAAELNKIFQSRSWTPRKIDMILWACRSCRRND